MVDYINATKSGPKVTRPNMTNATSEKQIDNYFDLSNPKAKWRNITILGVGLLNSVLLGIAFFNFQSSYWKIFTALGTLGLIIPTGILFVRQNSGYRFFTYLIDVLGILAGLYLFVQFPFVIIFIIITGIFMLDFFSTDFALQSQGRALTNIESAEKV